MGKPDGAYTHKVRSNGSEMNDLGFLGCWVDGSDGENDVRFAARREYVVCGRD